MFPATLSRRMMLKCLVFPTAAIEFDGVEYEGAHLIERVTHTVEESGRVRIITGVVHFRPDAEPNLFCTPRVLAGARRVRQSARISGRTLMFCVEDVR